MTRKPDLRIQAFGLLAMSLGLGSIGLNLLGSLESQIPGGALIAVAVACIVMSLKKFGQWNAQQENGSSNNGGER